MFALSLWFDHRGLSKLRIEQYFLIFKLIVIYGLSSSLMFIFNVWTVLWLYFTATYSTAAYVAIKQFSKKVSTLESSKLLFQEKGLSIDTVEKILPHILQELELSPDVFVQEYLKLDQHLLALNEKNYLNTPYISTLLCTVPMEIAVKEAIKRYWLDDTNHRLHTMDANKEKFNEHCKRYAWIILPFIPAIFIFVLFNHGITYINNNDFLGESDFNRNAFWKFRHFYEFEYKTKQRFGQCRTIADKICTNLFLASPKSSISKCFSFLFSVIGVCFLFLGLNGQETVFGVDLFILVGACAVLSAGTFLKKSQDIQDIKIINKIVWGNLSKHQLPTYFETKVAILIKETLSVLLVPYVLYYGLPMNSYFIAQYMSNYMNEDGYCTFMTQVDSQKCKWSKKWLDHQNKIINN